MDLKNDHNIYILGAGFSRAAGLPLISDFLVQMRDSHEWLTQQNRTREAESVAKVMAFRLDAASAAYWVNLDLENIEQLFSLAAATKGDMDRHTRIAIAATIDFARQTKPLLPTRLHWQGTSQLFGREGASKQSLPQHLPGWVQFSDQQSTLVISPYNYYVARLLGMFRDGKVKGENTFITFNYDTVLEKALYDLQVPFSYWLGEKEVHFQEDALGKDSPDSVPVLKLHGSTNWGRQIGPGGPLSVHRSSEEIIGKGYVPEIIPPTWKKLFLRQLETVWERAVQQLNTATRIIVIGFSIPPTDMHFQYLMAAGLQNNISLRQILFVDPAEPELLEPRIRHLLREAYFDSGQISIEKTTLEGFTRASGIGKIHTIGRPDEEGTTLRI